MKSISGIKRIIVAILLVCLVVLSGCTGGNETTAPTDPQGSDAKLTFVVADKTNWDKEVTLDGYSYTLAVNLKDGGVLELVGTCTGKAQAAATGGQQGGSSDGEETGEAAGEAGGEAAGNEETVPETEAPMTDADKAAKNFTKTGTWVYEAGYGYTVTIDGVTTKTNFDKASARHYFYMDITHNGSSTGLIQFQGKDTGFLKEIASDYEVFELRDAKIVFEAYGNTTTGNASTTSLYLEKDGTANSNVQSGSSTTYTRGSWVENADGSITLTIGGSVYNVDYCDVSGKEGYRVTYSSTTMYYTLSGAEVSYTDEDFNGKVVVTMQCAEQDYTLEVTERGFAVLKENGSVSTTGKYVVTDGIYTVTLSGVDYVSEGNTITISFEKAGDSSNTTTVTRTFNLDGTVPEASVTDPTEGGEPVEGGEEGSEGTEGSEGAEGTEPTEPVETQPVEGGEESSEGTEGTEGTEGSEGAEGSEGSEGA